MFSNEIDVVKYSNDPVIAFGIKENYTENLNRLIKLLNEYDTSETILDYIATQDNSDELLLTMITYVFSHDINPIIYTLLLSFLSPDVEHKYAVIESIKKLHQILSNKEGNYTSIFSCLMVIFQNFVQGFNNVNNYKQDSDYNGQFLS